VSLHERITRRNLPHWYVPGAMHFVTYRLAGTIPLEVLARLRDQREQAIRTRLPEGVSLADHRAVAHKRFFGAYDAYLDGACRIDWLANPAVAALIRGNLHHHNGHKYRLLAYSVMPNHVHALFQPLGPAAPPVATGGPPVASSAAGGPPAATIRGGPPVAAALPAEGLSDEVPDGLSPLASIMHSLKSYTAHKANELLGRSGQFWQQESYDHWVRDEDELERIVDYIAWNPVKAKLVSQPHEWYFSSAHDRFLADGSLAAYLE
jgi:putative DNA methylase